MKWSRLIPALVNTYRGLNPELHWQPSASRELLLARARLLAGVREYFALERVLEVETPMVSAASIPEPNIPSLKVSPAAGGDYWLHTSPEFPMKRLLAAGSGDIYQICRVFRDGELGDKHNPEFTMLEWYRLGLDQAAMMNEVERLLRHLCAVFSVPVTTFNSLSYQQAFVDAIDLDPLQCSLDELKVAAERHTSAVPLGMPNNKDAWLDWLLSQCVTVQFEAKQFTYLTQYPASQAALAKLDETGLTAQRFEVFYGELELANGFHELTDAEQQAQRFEQENLRREQQGQSQIALDQKLLAAMRAGLPPCSGVALGLDRLLMVLTGQDRLEQVIAFPHHLA